VKLFFATFIPGLQNIVSDVIHERLSDVVIHKLLDGAVLFETETDYDKLNFFCFNNIFAVISVLEESHLEAHRTCGSRRGDFLESYIKLFISCSIDFNKDIIINNNKKFKSFRIVISNENTPAAIEPQLRTEAEKVISNISGLKVNRSLPDTEFWFLYRKEENQKSFSVFMKRLTLRSSWDKTLHKGELPPPLAWTLCRLARLSHSDTVLDPFCGYGSIPEAAMKYFHITKFIACDNNNEAAAFTAEKFKKRKKGEFVFFQSDFFNLPSLLAEKSLHDNLFQAGKMSGADAIVTDPPWGHFKETDSGFPEKMFDVFYKLLKDNGRAVVLYANDDKFQKAASGKFNIEMNIPILLSGKKAVVFLLTKKHCFSF